MSCFANLLNFTKLRTTSCLVFIYIIMYRELLLADVWNKVDGCLFVLVKHLGVDLRRGQFSMSKEFGNSVDVRTEVKHHDGKGMTRSMEGDVLCYTGSECPSFQFQGCPCPIGESFKYSVNIVTTSAQVSGSLV